MSRQKLVLLTQMTTYDTLLTAVHYGSNTVCLYPESMMFFLKLSFPGRMSHRLRTGHRPF